MTDKQSQDAPQPASIQEVDRIRDIIFGSQMRDYDQQFQAMRREIKRLQEEIGRLEEQDSSQAQDLDDQVKALRKANSDLRRELRKADANLREDLDQIAAQLTDAKVDRAVLGDLLIELGTQLKTGQSVVDMLADLGATEQD